MLQLSADVYGIDYGSVDSTAITDSKWDLKLWVEELSAEGMIVQGQGQTVVTFKGSVGGEDWVTNVQFTQDKAKFDSAPSNVEVHGGWQDSLTDLILSGLFFQIKCALSQLNLSIICSVSYDSCGYALTMNFLT